MNGSEFMTICRGAAVKTNQKNTAATYPRQASILAKYIYILSFKIYFIIYAAVASVLQTYVSRVRGKKIHVTMHVKSTRIFSRACIGGCIVLSFTAASAAKPIDIYS